jgi:hypothetical protein
MPFSGTGKWKGDRACIPRARRDAVAVLRQAFEHGFKDGNRLLTDPDSVVLRVRPDFEPRLEELRVRSAPSS